MEKNKKSFIFGLSNLYLMDLWIILFIVSIVVVFLISYTIPNLATRGAKKPKKSKSPIPAKPDRRPFEFSEEELIRHDDVWDVGPPERNEDDMTFKGLRIAWKQFNSELDALIRDASSTTVRSHHVKKFEELNNYYITSLENHLDVLSGHDQITIKEKIAKAKRLIDRY